MRFFLLMFILVLNFCPSLRETLGIHIPVRNVGDFPLFTVGSSHKSPSTRSASAANFICHDIHIFSKQLVKFNHILK
jgi:hypothetical protein